MKKILFVLGLGLTFALVSCNFQPDEIPLPPPATEGNDTVETVATDDENTDTEIVIENDVVVEEIDDENETATEENDTVNITTITTSTSFPKKIKIGNECKDIKSYPFDMKGYHIEKTSNSITISPKNENAKIERDQGIYILIIP